jgi:hypothetical protein
LLLLGTAERVRPVPTLLYAMAGRQALVSNAASRCRRLRQPIAEQLVAGLLVIAFEPIAGVVADHFVARNAFSTALTKRTA